MRQFPFSTASTIFLLGGLLTTAPLAIPRLQPLRFSMWNEFTEFTPERTPLSPLIARIPEPIAPPPRLPRQASIKPLLDDSHGALDHFYQSLDRTERREPDAITRIVHYGDSPTTADLITGDVRALLQQRFGDAGHGFILVAKPWAWYQHRAVSLSDSGWQIFPATRFQARDGFFGLGGVSFTATEPARTRIILDDPGQSRFDLYFLRQPDGGRITISASGQEIATVDTQGDRSEPGFTPFSVEGGASELELQTQGRVRVFGLTAEKPAPGVVYDSLGLNGASITVLTRMFNQQHWATELRHRDPDMVVVNYGTNEADFGAFIDRGYEKELREAIRRIRVALPQASILIMSPMDRGQRNGLGDIETMETIPRIVDIQRRVALDTGCAFFDTFTAMGGAGTMARWYNAQPRLVSADLIHPVPAGGKRIAAIFVREIEAGLARYRLSVATPQLSRNTAPNR
jgi:lysophospholipase L1-like esterase